MRCFRILRGQVPSSPVFQLLQYPRRQIFLCVQARLWQTDLPFQLLCPRLVYPCADDQLLRANPVLDHVLLGRGLDPAQDEISHVQACGTRPSDDARLSEPLAQT